MSKLFYKILSYFDYFKKGFKKLFCERYQTGSITLGPGKQEVFISSDSDNPIGVYLQIDEPDDVPACIGNLNWIAIKLECNGFILYADIHSNTCVVNYIIKF